MKNPPVILLKLTLLCYVFSSSASARDQHDGIFASAPSLFKIDPSNILPTMVKYGGLVLPKEVEEDLLILNEVCSTKKTSIDIYNKAIQVDEFRVNVPGEPSDSPPALRVRGFVLKWNSYLRPCLEIEVEDIEVTVEFLNLLLTNSNWNELRKRGFPPRLLTESSVDYTSDESNKSYSSSFVRIGSLDLKGSVKLKLVSRSLGGQELCPDFDFDLSTLQELMDDIKNASDASKDKSGRNGCTTDELYDLIESFFKRKIKVLLRSVMLDIARGTFDPQKGSETIKQTRRVFSKVGDTFDRYKESAVGVLEQNAQTSLSSKLKSWGLSDDHVENVKKASKVVADTATTSFSSFGSRTKPNEESVASGKGTLGEEDEDNNKPPKERSVGMSAERVEWFKKGYQVRRLNVNSKDSPTQHKSSICKYTIIILVRPLVMPLSLESKPFSMKKVWKMIKIVKNSMETQEIVKTIVSFIHLGNYLKISNSIRGCNKKSEDSKNKCTIEGFWPPLFTSLWRKDIYMYIMYT